MPKKIKLTQAQQADYDAGKPVTITKPTIKWEPKGGIYWIDFEGIVYTAPSTKESREFGTEYPTKEQAEHAAKKMRFHNRLLCWLAEHDDGFVEKWDGTQQNWHVYQDVTQNIWNASWARTVKDLGTIYMSETNAQLLAKQLNEGIVEL